MRQIVLILAVLAIVLTGCDSLPAEQQIHPAESEVVRSAQAWLEAQGADIEFTLPKDGSSLSKGGAKKIRLQPDWDRAIELPFSETTSLLVAPIKDFTSTRVERRFIAEIKKGRVAHGYYLDFYGPSAASSDINSLVIDWQMNGRISSGFHIVAQFSVKMKFQAGGVYRDGSLVARGAFQKNGKGLGTLGKAEECSFVEDCTDYYFILEYPDGIEIIAYLGEYCTPPCEGGDGGGSGGDGGGGGGAAGEGSGSAINFAAMDACLMDLFWSSTLTPGEVIGSMVGTFANGEPTSGWNWLPTSINNFNLLQGGVPDATGLTYGSPVPGPGGSYWQSFFHMENLNAGTDLSALRTLFHEATHAFLFALAAGQSLAEGISYEDLFAAAIGLTDQGEQHNWMAQHYIEPMAYILQAYGDGRGYHSSLNATDKFQYYSDLAWGGLSNTSWFQNLDLVTKNRIADAVNAELNNSDPDAVGSALTDCSTGL